MTPVLEVAGLSFGYDARPVLDNISFRIDAGESVGLLGANGSGKSTLLWCIAGLLRASGTVRLYGEPPGRAGRTRVGMVFQNPEDQLFMPTLVQDLALPLVNAGVHPKEARRLAVERLRASGLDRQLDEPATHLSLGQRKRAVIALAMMREAGLLILDEPTAELDGRSVRQLTAALRGIAAAKLIASHHLDFLRATVSRILVLCEAGIMAEGQAATVLDDAALLDRAGLI